MTSAAFGDSRLYTTPHAALDRLLRATKSVPKAALEQTASRAWPGSKPQQASRAALVAALGVRGVAAATGHPVATVLNAAQLTARDAERAALAEPAPEFLDVAHPLSRHVIGGYGPGGVPLGPRQHDFGSKNGGCGPAHLALPVASCCNLRSAMTGGALGDLIDDLDAAANAAADYASGEGGGGVSGPAPTGGATGWPAAVPYRAGNWDYAKCEYNIAQGDTMSGISTRYLGAPNRWLEIWQIQPWRWEKAADPATSAKTGKPMPQVGDVLIMPKEACDKAKEMYLAGFDSAPATGGAPGTKPGAKDGVSPTAPSKTADKAKKYAPYVVGGVVVVGLAGAAIYSLS